ncbi:craniofacial development protein 2 [Plakobranchus ocellatus]|uniref:Craniofacial development protein 2 n=1 Tax=Plakobranchus ocellatus TaxID=259542 RepID=A0AAV4DBU4_9GAST|nr:craniofacial development protein 2 [Plakobranchus ocellatus]
MDRINLNILGLAEVRGKGAGSMKLGSKTLIYSGGYTHERGVGILFYETAVKSLRSWCPISDREVVAKLVAKPSNLGIIQVYAPTSDREDIEDIRLPRRQFPVEGKVVAQWVGIRSENRRDPSVADSSPATGVLANQRA